MTDTLARQAKAIATTLAWLLFQVRMLMASKGYADLGDIGVQEWIDVALNTLAGYGITYMVPNRQSRPAVT